MSKEVQIFFVHAPYCKKCSEMITAIEDAVKSVKIACKIFKFDYTKDEKIAVNIAINNDVEDLPFCVVSSKPKNFVFTKDNFSKAKIIDAIQRS